MRKFIRNACFFIFPLIALFLLGEILIRNIPNDYVVKKKYLERNSSVIKILCLGSSHAYYDINPACFRENCYNAAYVSQTVDYDYKIYHKYSSKLDSLKWIVLPISYFSFFSKMDTSPEAWRIKDYSIYSGLNGSGSEFMHYEMLSYGLSVNLKRIIDYYFHKSNHNLTCSDLGFGIDHALEKTRNLDSTGYVSAMRHTKYMKVSNFSYNEEAVENLLKLSKKNGVSVIIFMPPAWHTYTDRIDKNFLRITIDTVNELCRKYSNASYENYLNDKAFLKDDFLDADHLNVVGAKKLSIRIDSIINVRG